MSSIDHTLEAEHIDPLATRWHCGSAAGALRLLFCLTPDELWLSIIKTMCSLARQPGLTG